MSKRIHKVFLLFIPGNRIPIVCESLSAVLRYMHDNYPWVICDRWRRSTKEIGWQDSVTYDGKEYLLTLVESIPMASGRGRKMPEEESEMDS